MMHLVTWLGRLYLCGQLEPKKRRAGGCMRWPTMWTHLGNFQCLVPEETAPMTRTQLPKRHHWLPFLLDYCRPGAFPQLHVPGLYGRPPLLARRLLRHWQVQAGARRG